MKKFAFVFVILSAAAFAQPVRNHALATHHTIKGDNGFKKFGAAVKNHVAIPVKDVAVGSVITAYDSLEASVDALGVSLQAFADALDMGVAAPLESLPKPLNEIGVGVHEVYLGIDAAGQFLAK